MSVATEFAPEFAPVVTVPVRRHLHACPDPGSAAPGGRPAAPSAAVTVLHRPRDAEFAAPLRLTRRGVVVVAAVVLAVAVGVVWLAALGARSAGPAAAPARSTGAVTVHSGDTLWSIASRVAPDRDPRAEVADLQRVNHLTDAQLVPGQTLRLR